LTSVNLTTGNMHNRKETRYHKPIVTITTAIIDFSDRFLIHLEE